MCTLDAMSDKRRAIFNESSALHRHAEKKQPLLDRSSCVE